MPRREDPCCKYRFSAVRRYAFRGWPSRRCSERQGGAGSMSVWRLAARGGGAVVGSLPARGVQGRFCRNRALASSRSLRMTAASSIAAPAGSSARWRRATLHRMTAEILCRTRLAVTRFAPQIGVSTASRPRSRWRRPACRRAPERRRPPALTPIPPCSCWPSSTPLPGRRRPARHLRERGMALRAIAGLRLAYTLALACELASTKGLFGWMP